MDDPSKNFEFQRILQKHLVQGMFVTMHQVYHKALIFFLTCLQKKLLQTSEKAYLFAEVACVVISDFRDHESGPSSN